jgi:hypothetical protein
MFKAALTASIGICFAQHLWFVLSGNATSLLTIEKIFSFRTNILALSHLRSIRRAPLLFLMALLVWCLGLATLYPPGALIVIFEAHTLTENYNMSVMNPSVPQNIRFSDDDVTFPTLGGSLVFDHSVENFDEARVIAKFFRYPYVAPLALHTLLETKPYRGTTGRLLNIARSVIMNDQVLDLLVHPGENSTFNLQFRAPQFHCNSSVYNHSYPLEDPWTRPDAFLRIPEFASEWPWPGSDKDVLKYTIRKHSIESITVKRRQDNIATYDAQLETFEQSCWPISMLYNVTISFPRGVRKIEHKLSDARAIPDPKDVYDHNLGYLGEGNNSIYIALPAEPKALEEWNQKIRTVLPVSNEWVLLDALGTILAGNTFQNTMIPIPDGEMDRGCRESHSPDCLSCKHRETAENGTIIYDCSSGRFAGMREGKRESLS